MAGKTSNPLPTFGKVVKKEHGEKTPITRILSEFDKPISQLLTAKKEKNIRKKTIAEAWHALQAFDTQQTNCNFTHDNNKSTANA